MNGTLGLYQYNDLRTADLWVLLDYENQVWSFKYRIELQMPIIFLVPDTEGDVLVTSGGRGVQSLCLQYVSASNSSVLTRYQWNIRLKLKRLRFKESLVRHAFFPTEGNGGVDELPLFDGLSTAAV